MIKRGSWGPAQPRTVGRMNSFAEPPPEASPDLPPLPLPPAEAAPSVVPGEAVSAVTQLPSQGLGRLSDEESAVQYPDLYQAATNGPATFRHLVRAHQLASSSEQLASDAGNWLIPALSHARHRSQRFALATHDARCFPAWRRSDLRLAGVLHVAGRRTGGWGSRRQSRVGGRVRSDRVRRGLQRALRD